MHSCLRILTPDQDLAMTHDKLCLVFVSQTGNNMNKKNKKKKPKQPITSQEDDGAITNGLQEGLIANKDNIGMLSWPFTPENDFNGNTGCWLSCVVGSGNMLVWLRGGIYIFG